jgi:hypothetical protein
LESPQIWPASSTAMTMMFSDRMTIKHKHVAKNSK